VLAAHSEDYLFIPIKTPQGGGNRRGSHRQAETVKDLSNCLRRMKCCDDPHAAATTIAFENVECEHSAHAAVSRDIALQRVFYSMAAPLHTRNADSHQLPQPPAPEAQRVSSSATSCGVGSGNIPVTKSAPSDCLTPWS